MILICTVFNWVFASTPHIPVGQAKVKKTLLQLQTSATEQVGISFAAQEVQRILLADLEMMPMLTVFKENKPYDVSVQLSFSLKDSFLVVRLKMNTFQASQIVSEKIFSSPLNDVQALAHRLANEIVLFSTKEPGIFLTQIAMVCENAGVKELYVMNFDGTQVRQYTFDKSIVISPAWSPDGTRIAYSVMKTHQNRLKNIDLYELNLINGTKRLLSNKRGINSGATYSPDGRYVVVTLSYAGLPFLYSIDVSSLEVKKLIGTTGYDVDPAFSPDGKKIAFVSSRNGGNPMVYVSEWPQNADASVKRLTYAGKYNAAPAWSPNGLKMIFAGWIDKNFDIFMMNTNGTQIERLTKGQQLNAKQKIHSEDPHYSPDGNFIVFSSNRAGSKNIYVMHQDGSAVRRLTFGLGQCISPKWSPILQNKRDESDTK